MTVAATMKRMLDVEAIKIPSWVPPAFHNVYRMVAEKRGEEEAAALARRLKIADASDGSWTPERIEILVRTWLEGATSAKAAEAIGVTRNAVIGKKARLGLSKEAQKAVPAAFRPHLIAKARKVPPPVAAALEPPVPAVIEPQSTPQDGGVELLDLTRDQCRWPIADGPPMLFCGARKPADQPAFCQAHAARAYQGKAPVAKNILKAVQR